MPRLEGLRAKMAAAGVEGYLVARPENRFYLSGFTGDAGWCLITGAAAYLLVDPRFTVQAREEARGFTVAVYGDDFCARLRDLALEAGVKRIGFEADYLTYARVISLRDELPELDWIAQPGLVEALRLIKDDHELRLLRQAAAIADAALAEVLPGLRVGVKETAVALELENAMRRLGAGGTAFTTIVASGARSAMPHGAASDKEIAAGDLVVLDFGCVYRGYCSDITRTVVMGQAGARVREMYEVVLAAQLRALAGMKPMMPANEADALAREVIDAAGYGDSFGHGLGHGVGLVVHEGPRLGRTSDTVLRPGMAVTVEPGIYVEGLGGVRIEDTVVLNRDGIEVLTKSPKELMVL